MGIQVKALFDTNILIDYLGGVAKAREELSLYEQVHISLVTWMEVLVGAKSNDEITLLKKFLTRFNLTPVSPEIAERAVLIRRETKLRLPDAVIWATAQTEELLFVTRNVKDFPAGNPGIRIPYEI